MATVINPLRLDPSRTGQIRRVYSAEINARFNALIRDINKLLIEEDAFGVRADKRAGKRVFNASDCGAGEPGNPGFQPGNDCAKGDTIKLPSNVLKTKATSESDLPKQIGDYPISYSPGMGNEARADPDGTIKVGPKFFDMEVEQQNHTLVHEWVHQSGLEEAALNDDEFWTRLKAGDLWGKPEGEYDTVWGPGGNKPNENVVESVIAYINEPTWLREKYPGAYQYINDRLFTLPRKSVTVNSDCGAGKEGSPGFQPGNDCARGGERFSKVITDPKEAAKAIAANAIAWSQHLVREGRLLETDIPTREEIEKNWIKSFRSRKDNEGDKPAFKDLNPELKEELQKAIDDNASNEFFQAFVERHGDEPVIFRRQEKGRSPAAEYRAAIHVYDSPFWKGEVVSDLVPGEATAGGMGGYAAVIRHEYAHKLYSNLSLARLTEWRELVPASSEVEKGLTSYAAKNAEETFCELFAITTDKRYKPGVFPEWVDKLHAKQKEWML